MQASQSKNALELPPQDRAPDPGFARSLPSPFTAPIQAARKYFERQRGDAWQTGARDAGAPPRGVSPRGEDLLAPDGNRSDGNRPDGNRPDGQGPDTPGLISRELDRRLERSLYGHSIEAALSFAGPREEDAPEAAAAERAYFADSDGSEPLFPYAEPGPVPDPAAVRGAIQRLARETALSGAPEAAPPPAFRDVARRVWGADYPQFIASPAAEPDGHAAAGQPQAQAAASQFLPTQPPATQALPTQPLPIQSLSIQSGAEAVPVPPDRACSQLRSAEAGRSAAAGGPGTGSAAAGSGIRLEASGTYTASSREFAGAFAEETTSEPLTAEDEATEGLTADGQQAEGQPASSLEAAGRASAVPSSMPEAVPATAGPPREGVAQEGPALAHDACNLLSALALYSELLASPGVLGREHRHYAEELKLMAGRSQVLIDRLLRVAAERKAQGFPPDGHLYGPPEAAQAPVAPAQFEAKAVAIAEVGATDRTTRGVAEAQQSATAAGADGQAVDAAVAAAPRSPATDAERNGEAAVAAGFTENAPSEIAAVTAEEAQPTSLVYLLMRWGSLLSTLAHGTLEVGFGPHAATPVPAGAEALERILVNLVRNARAATALGGAIRIGVGVADAVSVVGSPDGTLPTEQEPGPAALEDAARAKPLRGTMVLTVDDSGCGMSEAQVRRILGGPGTPDGPADAGQAAGRGETRRRGLGLQIVRQLVAASGGTLSIQSWPGRGTRVEIHWPVEVRPAAEALAAIGETIGETPGQTIGQTTGDAIGQATGDAIGQAIGETGGQVPDAASRPEEARPTVFEAAAEAADAGRVACRAGADAAGPLFTAASAAAGPPPRADAAPPEQAAAAAARGPRDGTAGPVLAAAGPPSRSLLAQPAREPLREAVGPDGFSEADLRAMMLRLHRAGPQERSPLSRRLGDRRPLEGRPAVGRETDRALGDHGFGVHTPGVPAAAVHGARTSAALARVAGWEGLNQREDQREDQRPDQWPGQGPDQWPDQREAVSKGAIAC